MKRILILTASFGEGHNTAARNLKASAEAAGASAEVADLFAMSYGRLNELARNAYLATINNAPGVWARLYQLFDNPKAVEPNLRALVRTRRKLQEMIEQQQPAVIMLVYPVYAYLLEQIYKEHPQLRRPLLTVVTDSITINSIWYRGGSDWFIVPNDQTAQVLREAGVDSGKIRADGFPVDTRFNVPERRLSIDHEGGPRLLYMINFGKKEAPALVERLLALTPMSLTVTVGRNEELRRQVEQVAKRNARPIEIHGWTGKLPEIMLSHHVLLSIAGGATVQEAVAAKLPMIISQVVPGQEEGNARLLVENDCGRIAETPDAIVEAAREVLCGDGRLWRRWSENIKKLSRPDAADRIVEFALSDAVARN